MTELLQAMTSTANTAITDDTFNNERDSIRPFCEEKLSEIEVERINFSNAIALCASRGEILKKISDNWRINTGWVTMPLNGKKPIFKDWSNPNILKTSEYIRVGTWDKWGNIGLVTGIVSGVFVVDIDTKDGGVTDWLIHIKRYGEPKTLKVLTGGGGFHYYFKYEDKMKHFHSVTACAINDDEKKMAWDMRTTGGQVVIPPSIHPTSGKEYVWADLDADIISIPDWLFNLFDRYFANTAYIAVNRLLKEPIEKKTNLITEDDILSQDILIKMLNLLNPERITDFTLWRDVIWSIHAISDDYLDIAHLFSQKCPEKYKDGQGVNDVWDDWKSGGIGGGSLFHWLRKDIGDEAYFKFRRENGLSLPFTSLKVISPKIAVSPYNIDDPYYVKDFTDDISRKVFEGKTEKEAFEIAKAYVYPRMCRVARVITGATCDVVLKISKDNPFTFGCKINKIGAYGDLWNGFYYIKFPAPKNDPTDPDKILEKECGPFKLLLNNKDLTYESVVEDPYHVDIGHNDPRTFNIFKGFKARLVPNMTLEQAKIVCKPMLDHIFNIWARKDQSLFDYYMEWLACPIRDLCRTDIMLSIIGLQGCGKSIVFDFLRDFVCGEKVCLTITGGLSDITGNFNEMLPGKLYVSIDETATAGQQQGLALSQFEIMKSYITNNVILVKQKYKDARNVRNYCNFAVTSNNSQPVIVVEGDRRNMISECSSELIGNFDYFDNLAKEFPKMGDAFYTMCRLWPKTVNLKKIPNTEARQTAIEESKLQGSTFFDDYILNGSEAIDYQFIHFKSSWKNTDDEKRVFIQTKDLHTYYKYWRGNNLNGKEWSENKLIKEAKLFKGLIHHKKFNVDIAHTQRSYFEINPIHYTIVKICMSRVSVPGFKHAFDQPILKQINLQEYIDRSFNSSNLIFS